MANPETPSFTVSRPTAEVPQAADPLGEALHLLRLSGTLYCRAELSAPWGIALPAFEGCMVLLAITAGRASLHVRDAEPIELHSGSVVLLPHAVDCWLRSDPEVTAEPLFDIPVETVSDRYEIMRYGGGGELTHATCGVMRLDHVAGENITTLLPTVLHVDALHDDENGWLHSTLRLIAREAKVLRPGGETVITRLADVLVIQMIRSWIDAAPREDRGWLAALRDPKVGAALASIHREPAREWTVASLAKGSGMSRSAFSARFTDLVGQSAMQYLTRWRMQLARTHLRGLSEPLASVAERVGYRSEAAFCRAFKREFGVSPGSIRSTP